MKGEILKRRLLETGKTQKEIAELLNITPQSINAILSASDVRSSTIEKLAKVLRLPVSFFYEGSELDKEQKSCGRQRQRPRNPLPAWSSRSLRESPRHIA